MAGKKSDPTIVVVAAICVIIGIAHGPIASSGDPWMTSSSSRGDEKLRISSVDERAGTVGVATEACTDDPKALDVVRYVVADASGREVAHRELPLEAGRTQRVTLGSHLPKGRYRVVVTCLADGSPVGPKHVVWAGLGVPAEAQGTSGTSGKPGLPNSGR